MAHTQKIRRIASAVGATAVLGLALAGPASARQDPGEPVKDAGSGVRVERTFRVPVDDNALEFLQIGLGALGGVALAGAGAAAITAARHREQHAM